MTNRRIGDRRIKFMVVSTGELRKAGRDPRKGVERRVDTDTTDFYGAADNLANIGLSNLKYIDRRGTWPISQP